jgi:ATP-dependent Zn protease
LKKKKGFLNGLLSYVLLIGIILIVLNYMDTAAIKEINYTDLMKNIEEQKVESVELSYDRMYAKVVYNNDTIERTVTIPNNTAFMEAISDRVGLGEFKLTVAEQSTWEIFFEFLPTIITIYVQQFKQSLATERNSCR